MHLSFCAFSAITNMDTNECKNRMLLEMYGFNMETMEMFSYCSDTASMWKGGVSHQLKKQTNKKKGKRTHCELQLD